MTLVAAKQSFNRMNGGNASRFQHLWEGNEQEERTGSVLNELWHLAPPELERGGRGRSTDTVDWQCP